MTDARITISSRKQRGAILIIAMIIIFALASLVLVLGQSIRAEAGAAANRASAQEAAAIARGAEQYVLAMLSEADFEEIADLDESAFAAVPVGSGYFWIIRPNYDDPTLPVYGLVDESSKLDLNRASIEMLRRLPGMTEEIAASILDWRDEDQDITAGGAETQNYLAQAEPYQAKSGEFETVEELLMIRGMTRELLYGPGGNVAASAMPAAFASEYYQLHGFYDLFTVWSVPSNTSTDGQERINVNSQDQRDEVRRMLREELGESRGNEVGALVSGPPFQDVFDFARRLNLQQSEFEQIGDRIIVGTTASARGRINVNAAPREVLLCLDNLAESDVDALLARRDSAVASNPGSIAWVYDVLKDKAVGLGNQITGRGGVYSADIVAASGNGRAFRRVRIVVDANAAPPRIIYRRDLTEQGWPMDPTVLASLRAGEASFQY